MILDFILIYTSVYCRQKVPKYRYPSTGGRVVYWRRETPGTGDPEVDWSMTDVNPLLPRDVHTDNDTNGSVREGTVHFGHNWVSVYCPLDLIILNKNKLPPFSILLFDNNIIILSSRVSEGFLQDPHYRLTNREWKYPNMSLMNKFLVLRLYDMLSGSLDPSREEQVYSCDSGPSTRCISAKVFTTTTEKR